jgi:hypothetical protein
VGYSFQIYQGRGKKKPFPGVLTGTITKDALGGLEKYQTLCRRCFLHDKVGKKYLRAKIEIEKIGKTSSR